MSSASSWQCWFCSHAPSLDVPFCSILSCPKQRQPVPTRAGSRPHPSLCWGAEMVELVMPRNCAITYRHVLTFPWVHTFSYRSCSSTSVTLQNCIASRTSSLRNLNHIMVQKVMRHVWLVAGAVGLKAVITTELFANHCSKFSSELKAEGATWAMHSGYNMIAWCNFLCKGRCHILPSEIKQTEAQTLNMVPKRFRNLNRCT